jgi:hypothetical protein
MPTVDRKLVHPDHRDPSEVHRAEPPLEHTLVDLLNRLPVEVEVPGGVPDRHHRAQPTHRCVRASHSSLRSH